MRDNGGGQLGLGQHSGEMGVSRTQEFVIEQLNRLPTREEMETRIKESLGTAEAIQRIESKIESSNLRTRLWILASTLGAAATLLGLFFLFFRAAYPLIEAWIETLARPG